MNNKTTFKSKQPNYRVNYKNSKASFLMSQTIISSLPKTPKNYVVVFIGTDRSTGDALGPIAGTLLKKTKPSYLKIYGDLHRPIHAQNIRHYINLIHNKYARPYIIAIDACLGRNHSIGDLITGSGPLLPGAALNKKLPAIGDLFLTGVVNLSGYMEYAILQNTRLSVVSDMAETIASILLKVDQHLSFMNPSTAIATDSFISIHEDKKYI